MADEQKKILPIDYTHREYESIRNDLMGIVERFYPDTLQDFSDGSFGSMMLDAVAYVGDQLSFYLDYNVNECFLDTAYQYDNVVRHGRILGYKAQGRPSTYGEVSLFVMVPASSTGIGPDTAYVPILSKGTTFTSGNGLAYILTENVDFSLPTNTTIVAQVNKDTGAPTWYAIKAPGTVVSGRLGKQSIKVNNYQRFLKLQLSAGNISEIISVTDTEGNEYYEVDYLAQDMVFKEIANKNFKNDNVPSILKPYLVSRKFTVERNRYGVYLQFGSGKSGETDVIADPGSVAMDIFGKDYVSSTTFDPTRLSKNYSLGYVPSNTILTITYRTTNPSNSNIGASQLNKVSSARLKFADELSLNSGVMTTIMNSVEVTNDKPIIGAVSYPTSTEVKRRIYDTFPTQNRAVTQADYENLAYRMPAKYGSIARCSTQKDPDSLKRNLNMYIISSDNRGYLTETNSTIKNNLKMWLNHYRMINDTVDILDPYIVNIGINFIIKPQLGADKFVVLNAATQALKKKYKTKFYIGEPLYISDIYQTLKGAKGVLDVTKVTITNPQGTNYSGTQININNNLSPDGSYLVTPKNAILELKYPEVDVKGKVQ